MTRKAVSTDAAPAAIGPYSQAIEVAAPSRLVFVSGQIPIDPATGEKVVGDAAAQTEQVMKNLAAVLAAAGLSLSNVVKTTIFVTDLGAFKAVNEAYGRHFEGDPPARATIQVSALPLGVDVEIECVAAG